MNFIKKKNRILLICQHFHPEYVTSALLPYDLAIALGKEDFHITVLTGYPYLYNDEKKISNSFQNFTNVKIKRFRYLNLKSKSFFSRLVNFFSFFIVIFFSIPRYLNYNLVIIYSNPPILPLIGHFLKSFSNIKFIFVCFDLYPFNAISIGLLEDKGFLSSIMKFINKKVYSSADSIIAISQDMKDFMIQKFTFLEEYKVKVIPNWFTGEIKKTSLIVNKEFLELRSKYKLIFIYTGNIGEAQDMDTISKSIIELNSVNFLSDILFIFSGHGVYKKKLQEKFLNLNILNTRFYGFLKNQDIIDLFNIADFGLLSLKKGIEGLGVPSKFYGYLAYDIPVISIMSHQTEIAQMLEKYDAGFNILQGDITHFFEVILSIKEDSSLLHKKSNNAKQLFNSEYTKEISISKYILEIKRMLK
jgi:glycosyltransferase involved in cell wall biosynthesis